MLDLACCQYVLTVDYHNGHKHNHGDLYYENFLLQHLLPALAVGDYRV